MRHVRALTIGKPVIMGRRTYDSIGKPLPDRTNIVMTRDVSFHPDGVKVARSKEQALALAGDAPEIIVFGGAEIFTPCNIRKRWGASPTGVTAGKTGTSVSARS